MNATETHPCPCGCGRTYGDESTARTNGSLHRTILSDDRLAAMFTTRTARWRYFQRKRGPMFCWTTERVDGKFDSFVMRPVGEGSRSGTASNFERVDKHDSRHRLRKDAKARALRLFEQWQDSGGIEA